jgi:hypothetical protein
MTNFNFFHGWDLRGKSIADYSSSQLLAQEFDAAYGDNNKLRVLERYCEYAYVDDQTVFTHIYGLNEEMLRVIGANDDHAIRYQYKGRFSYDYNSNRDTLSRARRNRSRMLGRGKTRRGLTRTGKKSFVFSFVIAPIIILSTGLVVRITDNVYFIFLFFLIPAVYAYLQSIDWFD